jgi:hypothetical protein
MWIAKGLLLGVWLFTFGTIVWLCVATYRYIAIARTTIPRGHSISIPPDLGFFPRLTVSSPSWWLAFVACLSVALIVTRSWSGRPILWIGLALTELVPIGFLAFSLVQMNKLPRLVLGPWPQHQGRFHPPGTP